MQAFLQVIALTAGLYLAQELLRKAGKWVLWTLFLVVPAVLTPYWFAKNDFGLFVWVKIYSVCACVVWGAAIRFTRLPEFRLAGHGLSLLLAGNIIEATTLDFVESRFAHQINAIAGVLLVLTIPYGLGNTRVDTDGRHRDAYLQTSRAWFIGYTIWNWTFVYLNYPALTGHHTAVLLAGLIVGLIDARRWAQSRAAILGLNLLGMATINDEMINWLATTSWFDERLAIVLAVASLSYMILHGAWKVRGLATNAAGNVMKLQGRVLTTIDESVRSVQAGSREFAGAV